MRRTSRAVRVLSSGLGCGTPSEGDSLALHGEDLVRIRYGPAVLVSDLRHFLDLPDRTPAPALRLAQAAFFASLVTPPPRVTTLHPPDLHKRARQTA